MRIIRCTKCGHEGPYFIVEITEDYVTLRCPICEFEVALPVGMDLEK